MRLTRRGLGVVGVIVACVAMAGLFGPRSLNAFVAPLVVVLIAAVAMVYRAETPTFHREPVPEGFPGDRRTVGLRAEVDGSVSATVRDGLPDDLELATEPGGAEGSGATAGEGSGPSVGEGSGPGLREGSGSSGGEGREGTVRPTAGASGGEPTFVTTLVRGSRLEYDVRLGGRGERPLGPITVTVEDVMGLVTRETTVREMGSVLVYPPVYELVTVGDHGLAALLGERRSSRREEFDHLREYRRGDRLRDVHWKATAKDVDHDPVVKEFEAEDERGGLTIVADPDGRSIDETASACASLATHLLSSGLATGLVVPGRELPPAMGAGHHRELLRTLARLEPGRLPERAHGDRDVLVTGADGEATIVHRGDETPFEAIRGDRIRRSIVSMAAAETEPLRRRPAGVVP